jgi:hypothetical protein
MSGMLATTLRRRTSSRQYHRPRFRGLRVLPRPRIEDMTDSGRARSRRDDDARARCAARPRGLARTSCPGSWRPHDPARSGPGLVGDPDPRGSRDRRRVDARPRAAAGGRMGSGGGDGTGAGPAPLRAGHRRSRRLGRPADRRPVAAATRRPDPADRRRHGVAHPGDPRAEGHGHRGASRVAWARPPLWRAGAGPVGAGVAPPAVTGDARSAAVLGLPPAGPRAPSSRSHPGDLARRRDHRAARRRTDRGGLRPAAGHTGDRAVDRSRGRCPCAR